MKTLWIAAALALAGCNGSGSGAPEPVVMVIGDSVSIQWTPSARRALCGEIVVQHESGISDEPEAPEKSCDIPNVLHQIGRPANNGCAASALFGALPRLEQWRYNVILFNAGLHDTQYHHTVWKNGDVTYTCGGPTPLDEYRNSLEHIADLLVQRADAVVFVMTTPVSAGNNLNPVGEEVSYNQVLKDVAREHGFYILTFTDIAVGKHNIHLSGDSVRTAGVEAAACIETTLQDSDSEECHR